jgi:hypothetical protein
MYLQGGGDMSALKHFNTGSIRQGFIIDEVSVHCRVMGQVLTLY